MLRDQGVNITVATFGGVAVLGSGARFPDVETHRHEPDDHDSLLM
jgi:hypothetical protein